MKPIKAMLQSTVFTMAAASTLAAIAPAALAQTDTNTDREQIIVTTERREQNIQDVAATVQNFSAMDLQTLGINSDFENLQYAVPGLQIAQQEGKFEVFLRGIGSTDSDFSSDPSVATHFNGVYMARPRGIGPLFFDVERVEVNKGPQGTLRGRNATGGTINVISARPDMEEFGGYVQAGVGNFENREFEAAINLPVTDTFALRASAWHRAHDGLYTNQFDTGPAFEGPSSQDDMAWRLSGQFEPTDNFTAYFLYQDSEVGSSGDPGAFAGRALSAGYDIDDLDDPWNQYFRRGGSYDADVETALVTLFYDFGGVGVEYSGSQHTVDAYNANASREWQLGMVYPGSDAEAANIPFGVQDTFYQGELSEGTTHELRFFSTDAGRLQWTAGAFYFEEEYDYLSWDVGRGYCGDSDWFEPGTISCWQNGLGGENRGDASTVESMAFYADGTYDISDTFRVKAGIRYTEDEKIANESNAQYQIVFTDQAWQDQFGSAFDGNTYLNFLTLGTDGFRLEAPGGRSSLDPVVCEEFSFASLSCEGGVDANTAGAAGLAHFLDGISRFGINDTWDDLLENCDPGVDCWAFIRSAYPDGTETNSVENDYVDWRLGFEYDLDDDRMVYGTVSTGTRSGGVNLPIVAGGVVQTRIWEPEELTVWEFGSKNEIEFMGRDAILNAALFFYDYSDKVIQNLVDIDVSTPTNPGATTQVVLTDNVASANVWGFELEGNFDFDYGFNAAFNLLYLDSEFENSTVYDSRSNTPGISIDGNRLPNTSEWNLNARLSQTIDIEHDYVSSVDWTVNMMYRSEYFLSPFNSIGYDSNGDVIPLENLTPGNNGTLSGIGGDANGNFLSDRVDGFAIFNANAGMNFGADENLRLDVYVENLTEEAFSTKGFINNSVNIRYLNSPRQYGVRLRASF